MVLHKAWSVQYDPFCLSHSLKTSCQHNHRVSGQLKTAVQWPLALHCMRCEHYTMCLTSTTLSSTFQASISSTTLPSRPPSCLIPAATLSLTWSHPCFSRPFHRDCATGELKAVTDPTQRCTVRTTCPEHAPVSGTQQRAAGNAAVSVRTPGVLLQSLFAFLALAVPVLVL
jgi:hypothetical protein